MDVRVRAARNALHLKDTDMGFENPEGKEKNKNFILKTKLIYLN